MTDRNLYIIAGCNGAGKTTASFTILPEIIDCKEFVNADEIAKGLSPFQPETVAFEAGRIMLNRINTLLADNQSFAFETTLSTRSYKSKVLDAQQKGYTVTLLFFWLQTVELAKERVKSRVAEGGHNIEPDVIERRYVNGILNLFTLYLPIVDGALIFDNSAGQPELLARKTIDEQVFIVNQLSLINLKSTMTTVEQQNKLYDKIVAGMDKVYERLIAYKKQKNSELVVIRDNKIVKIKPE